ncbi:uncharacterized protein EAF02_003234 [Botrytis sinoallii]|uniref:uncharacterized protein n=1 Tax=Botrytis sinoallii TaxID=1463999 RepID=UPI00190245B9|nr:uncharacterized protein EAF02_003234 [Botrytis sinoallii]KAF7888693.1 hypothetical protein EAF02_003234 [Botrytis sinoallii]
MEKATTIKDHTGLAKSKFRLLHLKSGTGNQQLCATIRVEPMDSAAAKGYICLSYVWGTEISTERIKVDDSEVSIHASLLTCLRHVRNPHHPLVLWIDALCVDQNDPDEIASQIANLGEIYSRCSLVYVWLGAPPNHIPTTGDPFQLIRHFSDNKHYHELAGYYKANSGRICFEENSEFHDLWDKFLLVGNSTWFTRVWTVQEAVLSPDPVLCYGSWRSTLETLISAQRNRKCHTFNETQCCKNSLGAFPRSKILALDQFFLQIELIERFRQDRSLQDHSLYCQDTIRAFPELIHRPFYEIVLTFSNRVCMEPRDRIFSVLAMAQSLIMKSYRPNYSARWIDLYTEVFKLMLQETGNDYRCMIGPAFGSDHSNLPSWVPDFSVTIPLVEVEAVIRRISSSTLCEASGKKFGVIRIHGPELSISGRWVDTISTVGSLLPTVNIPAEALKDILLNWKSLCEKIVGICRETSVRVALSRVICASKIADGVSLYGRHHGWRQIKTNDLPSVEEWSQFLGGDVWTLQEEYRGAFEIASTGRCFYITKNGKMGLCYPQVKAGDQVWVLKNSNSPFVLREVDSESSNAQLYRFIGDCYLDGTIDEEFVRATKEGSCITLV